LKAGATKEEIFEVAVVAIHLGGGPAMTYRVRGQTTLDKFTTNGGK